MGKFEIWSEGHVCTGSKSNACLMGVVEAGSFEKACRERFRNDPNFDRNKMTYWACKLFDNESDAKKLFG